MPEFTPKEVAALYSQLEDMRIKIWLDGGWGVDALLGKQTRAHKDLDIAINQKDVPQFMAFIATQGYTEVRRDSDYNIVMRDGLGREIDFHAFITDDAGSITGGVVYPNESLTGTGTIGGHSVRCIAPEYMVKFHTGYELTEKDYKDVLAVCTKFNIALPDEYTRFIK